MGFSSSAYGQTVAAGAGITADMIYKLVRKYSPALGFKIGAHALRAAAATNALDHQADIAKYRNGWDTQISPRRGL